MEDPTPAQGELETSSTPAEGSLTANTKYSSAAVESSCNNDDPDPLAGGCDSCRNGIDLPPELLIIIFQAFLPIVNQTSLWQTEICKCYMKNLSLLRLVSRTWRDLLNDTPTFWTILSSTVPRIVNQTSITRSGEAPVIVHFGRSPTMILGGQGGSDEYPDGFTELVGSIRDRWKVVYVQELAARVVWEYLNSPASMIETVHLHVRYSSRPVTLDLLGGEIHNIRYLNLHSVKIPWSRSEFRGLKHLGLLNADERGLTMDVILDMLANNPDLESLKISWTAFPVSTAPFSHPIYLPHLRTLELTGLPGPRLFPLLHLIEAPHCQIIKVEAKYGPGSDEWLDKSLGFFESLLRELHKQCGGSILTVCHSYVDWRTRVIPWWGEPGFEVQIWSNSFVSLLRWVERVVDEAALEDLLMKVYISGENRFLDPEFAPVLRRLRSVAEVYAGSDPENGRETVRFLGNPDHNPIPILLSLRLLRVAYEDISAEEVLQMLRTRFAAHCNHGGPRKLPDLEVVAELAVDAQPVPIKSLPFAVITQIRSITGVKFRFNRHKEGWNRIGTCAIVWEDEEGVPKWV
ncbi:hypothetical protein FS837_005158 [Tulasnella sp. UAMH 9824]|nr:hypothetical protein FS837_005158 [Tulasnella sp. UAMH 9824]